MPTPAYVFNIHFIQLDINNSHNSHFRGYMLRFPLLLQEVYFILIYSIIAKNTNFSLIHCLVFNYIKNLTHCM